MKILALIPARGGSKRLPRKNIRKLGEKPLICWTIEIAKQLKNVCDILVSTDDEEIAEIARASGAIAPWLRPIELSRDDSTSVEVALHALQEYEKENGTVDALLLLQPTSPFRNIEKIRSGIDLFCDNKAASVVGVSPCTSHPYWCLKIQNSKLVPFFGEEKLVMQSQKLPDMYVINGSFYLISTSNLKKNKSFYGEYMLPLKMECNRESLDIDTEEDWGYAEYLLTQFKN